jgi:CubicO group peptidase (beta-lactamase class C family)
MKSGDLLLASVASLLFAVAPRAMAAGKSLPRSTPESQGVSSQVILDYIAAADKINTMHSIMIVRHGQVITEGWWKPESAEKPHILNSLSKSFTSTAVGLAIEDGKLNLDDDVLKFFPSDAPAEISDNLKALKVRDLLTMTGGHDSEPKTFVVKDFLAHPFVHKPGTHFHYNSKGTYVLSSIITKVTGKTVLEYLKPRLFEPLGIENPEWAVSSEGNSIGGSGLKLRTEDIAKFGQLYLQKGKWNGKQLVPEKWVEQATSKQVPDDKWSTNVDWQQGYGYQFWVCTHNAVRGDGAGGQFCVLLPAQDVVIAITADTSNMQAELSVVWDKLLPAFQSGVLSADPATQEKLKEVISKLAAHPAPKKAN